jgi:hypothetical protein
VYHNDNSGTGTWAALASTPATGTDPYQLTATGVSNFSAFAVGSAATPLPVTLVSFGARRTSASNVAVSWATATEWNCARFEVERSADGRQFQRMGAVPCAGAATPYAFPDATAYSAAYYRLRQVDADGQAHYSASVYVPATTDSSLAISLFPNPTTGTVTLLGVPDEAVLTLSLSSPLGQLLLPPSTAALPELTARLNATLAACAPGVYVLTAESNGQRQHLKVIKQ